MAGMTRFGCLAILNLVLFAGCSKQAASTADQSSPARDKAAQANPANNPMAHAASDWLTAVLKGDTQRASALLTPQAMQRIIASGKQFAPPGLDTASFRIGDVRAPSPDQAIVQCVLTDTSQGDPHSEEMCCLLRRVDNEWRVSGIAYGTAPDQPWTLTDFETGQNTSISRQAPSEANASAPSNGGAAGRPSPPRTAQEAPAAERR